MHQWSLMNNSGVLSNNLAKLTNKSLDSINFSTDDIDKKAHRYNMLSIPMIKLCENSICLLLSEIFNNYLKEGKFPSDWKKLMFTQLFHSITFFQRNVSKISWVDIRCKAELRWAHTKCRIQKICKTMCLLHRFQRILPRSSWQTIYKTSEVS